MRALNGKKVIDGLGDGIDLFTLSADLLQPNLLASSNDVMIL